MKMKQEQHTLTGEQLKDPTELFQRLYWIFKETLYPAMTYEKFVKFYTGSKPHYMQITFLTEAGEDIGFFTCAYSHMQLMDRRSTVCRVAIGILKEHHGGKMPFGALCRRIISYKFRHPFTPVYMVAYLANPLVYATIAKYTAEHWPARNKATPQVICDLKENILRESKMQNIEVRDFVLKIHFPVSLSEALIKRIFGSKNPDVKFYLERNPEFTKQMGLMTIVPVRWFNVFANIHKAMVARPLKKTGMGLAKFFMLHSVAV